MKRSCCFAMFAVIVVFTGTVMAQEKLISVKVELITRAIAYDRGSR